MEITINGMPLIQTIGFLVIYLPIAFGPLVYSIFVRKENDPTILGVWACWAIIVTVVALWVINNL